MFLDSPRVFYVCITERLNVSANMPRSGNASQEKTSRVYRAELSTTVACSYSQGKKMKKTRQSRGESDVS